MRADLTRGHRPDHQRGQQYRRVLTQQGRVWLDSDAAASVDATDRLLRHLGKDMGCPAGSPDTGFLASPGRPFAWFDSLDHVAGLPEAGAPFRAYRDYAVKYLERLPSLYVDARAEARPLTIRGRDSFDVATAGKLRFWLKLAPGAAPLALSVNGTHVAAAAPTPGNFGFDAYDYDLAGAGISPPTYTEVQLGFAAAGASNEAWLGFVEAFGPTALAPRFWITKGRYYADGLEVEWPTDAGSATFLDSDVPATSGRFVAYLEAWERLVTHIEEPGLRDSALGGLDTTARTRAMGQVKLAELPASLPPLVELVDAIALAFRAVNFGDGQLDVKPAVAAPNPDPCAIPAEGGYNADENRLYRFEVHSGGDLGVASIKWSRNNGSELHAAAVVDAAQGLFSIRSTPGTAPPQQLVENDLVELITENTDLGDEARASVSLGAAPSVTPARRRVGRLCLVKTTSVDGVVQLCDLGTAVAIDFTQAGAPPQPERLRKWDGLIASTAAPSTHTIEDGLDLELGGADFRPGDYWQFEARRLGNNAGSPWQLERHGPERILSPLALFKAAPNAATPVELEHWFDDRFRPLCELRADDIYYDGDKSGTDADTVQEAIDELYELVDQGGGCCDFTLTPSDTAGADDTARLQDLINEVEEHGKICLERGVYVLQGTLVIDKKHVTIEGCPEAIVLAAAESGPVFELGEMAGLGLENLVLRATGKFAVIEARDSPAAGEIPQNRIDVTLKEAWVFHVGTGAILQDGATAEPTFALNTDSPWQAAPPTTDNMIRLRVEHSVLCGRTGVLVDRVGLVELNGSILSTARVGIMSAYTWASRIVISESRVTCDFYDAIYAAIESAAPEALTRVTTQVFEYTIGFAPDSVAIAAEGVRVEVFRSRVGGAAGILGNCSIDVNDSAIDGEESSAVFASSLDLVATETSFGSRATTVHGTNVGRLELTRCRIGGQRGVALAVSTNFKDVGWVSGDVHVVGCDIEVWPSSNNATLWGLLLGGPPAGFLAAPARAGVSSDAGIRIADNHFRCGYALPESFAVSVALDGASSWRKSRPVVEGNRVEGVAAFGICVRGAGFVVGRNDVAISTQHYAQTMPRHASIAVFGGADSVIAENAIRLFVDKTTEDARGITLLGVAEESSVGIVVRNNGATLDPKSTGRLRPLVTQAQGGGSSFSRLVIESNELGGHEVSLPGTSQVTIISNRFLVQEVQLPNASGGRLQDNRVLLGDGGQVVVSGLTGAWQVAHNECSVLSLSPSAHWVFDTNGNSSTFPLATYALLTQSARPTPEAVDNTMRAALRGLTEKEPAANFAALPKLAEDDLGASLAYGVALELGSIFDELVTGVALAAVLREVTYKAHVADNCALSSLAVGNQGATPSAASWVQVLGNQVGGTLTVGSYLHSIVVNNLAGELAPTPLGSVATAIAIHNHNA